jgi:hypothetical protein
MDRYQLRRNAAGRRLKMAVAVAAVVLTAVLTAACAAHKEAPVRVAAPVEGAGEYAPRTLIVAYDAAVGKEPLLRAARKMGCRVIYDYRTIRALALRLPEGLPPDKAIRRLKRVRGVLQVSRDRINYLHSGGGTEVQ